MGPRSILLCLGLALAACGPAPVRLAVPPLDPGERIGIGFGSVEVVEVSLPAYAEDEEIFLQTGIALARAGGTVWADDTTRAFTEELSRALLGLTGARVAPEPWPYDEPAAARLDLRVAEFAPDLLRSAFVIRGQYFVAAQDESGRDRARDFLALGRLPPDPGPADYALARAEATLTLARQIAAEGLR
jgi:uncharacterized lipoprotein YmbA